MSASKSPRFSRIIDSSLSAGIALCLAFLVGCPSTGKVSPTPRPDTAPVLGDHIAKDAAIIAEAAAIDKIAPAAKPHTDAQRAAVAAAPSVDLKPVFNGLNRIIDAQAEEIEALRKEVADLKAQALREQARWLTWSGVALLGAFGVSIFFGQLAAAMKTWPLAVLGVGCFGLAQLISHPWFVRGFGILLAGAIAYGVYWVIDRKRDGRIKRSLEKKAALLGQIVPVLDDAYDNAAESIKGALDANIFERLTGLFSKEDKAVIHEVRADAKRAAIPAV